jgi:hypothetical protein
MAEFIEGSPIYCGQRNVFMSVDIFEVPTLEGHSSYSAYLDFRHDPSPDSPIIQIWVDFHSFGIPFKVIKRGFRFFARKNTEGKYQWFPSGQAHKLLVQEKPQLNW